MNGRSGRDLLDAVIALLIQGGLVVGADLCWLSLLNVDGYTCSFWLISVA